MKELGECMDDNSYRSTKGVCGPLSNEDRRDEGEQIAEAGRR